MKEAVLQEGKRNEERCMQEEGNWPILQWARQNLIPRSCRFHHRGASDDQTSTQSMIA